MKYSNPILWADYSDPDVIRVGEDFYMISSSFTYVPGIPVLRSRDLVHWELINYVVKRLPFSRYDVPVHKCGTWAPSIRWHDGLFYVYVCLPDEGLFAYTAEDPAGEWECHDVMKVTGWIDPCPLFEENGRAWLVHGFAASRVGINNILYVHEMSPDGFQILDRGRLVYSGLEHEDTTVEGPKLYKRNDQYWILCPAGGVKPGYQLALRADNIFGPYERKVVLQQGKTAVNGPHQGGWVEDGHGRDWFLHFQDVEEYGRIVHLQPVDWSSGWPIMGNQGEPVQGGDTGLAEYSAAILTSDKFSDRIGLQWQWQANPNPGWYSLRNPGLRLHAAPANTLFEAGQFLSQLMQSRDFEMVIELRTHFQPGDLVGIGIMGYPYHYLAVTTKELRIVRGDISEASGRREETARETILVRQIRKGQRIQLKMTVKNGWAQFASREADEEWNPVGELYPLKAGGWTGARPGVFCMNQQNQYGGWAEIDSVIFH